MASLPWLVFSPPITPISLPRGNRTFKVTWYCSIGDSTISSTELLDDLPLQIGGGIESSQDRQVSDARRSRACNTSKSSWPSSSPPTFPFSCCWQMLPRRRSGWWGGSRGRGFQYCNVGQSGGGMCRPIIHDPAVQSLVSRSHTSPHHGEIECGLTLRTLWCGFSPTCRQYRCLCYPVEGTTCENANADALLSTSLVICTPTHSLTHTIMKRHSKKQQY